MYTRNEYEQDKRIAELTFYKCFGKHYLQDELIHVAVIKLWETRLEHGGIKDYFLQAFQIAKRAMFMYLRKEKRHCYHACLLDEVYDGLQLIDTIPNDEQTPDEKNDYKELVEQLIPLPILMNKKAKQIINLWFKHYTQTEIAAKLNVSHQYASQIIMKFREQAKQVLEGGAE